MPVSISIAGIWKGIFKIEEDLKQANIQIRFLIRGFVGTGENIMFWLDRWAGESPLMDAFPRLFALERNKMVTIAECYNWVDGQLVWVWRWRREPVLQEELAEVRALKELIRTTQLSDNEDGWRWGETGDETFTVKDVKTRYTAATQQVGTYKFSWNNWAPRKVNLFSWRAEMNRIPTIDNLIKRNIQVDSERCKMCGDLGE
ncbi:putative reverse transcriptase zinc-binding domain-containing protein [Helianthus annuus]|nr:putative reverse transcriptase zinc-binding domain-containing protein [Helianthus annuus]